MNNQMNNQNYYTGFGERELAQQAALPALMRKVYTWMSLALVITAIAAYGTATSGLAYTIAANPLLFWGLIIGELALVFGVSAGINKLSITTATLLFVLYSVINGVTLSFIFFAYTMASIAKVFFITAATFGVMAVYGYTTKTDLSKMGKILFMALIGLIIAVVVNIFVKSTMFDLVISCVGVLIFVGLTAWDTQKIKAMLYQAEPGSETTQKIALMGALSLYLDFINLFIYLLRLLGRRD